MRPTREARAALRAVRLGSDALLERLDRGEADAENVTTTFQVLHRLLERAEQAIEAEPAPQEPRSHDGALDLFDRIRGYLAQDPDAHDLPAPVGELTDAQLLELMREDLRIATDSLLEELGVHEQDDVSALVPHDAADEASAFRWVAEVFAVASGRDPIRVLQGLDEGDEEQR